MYCYHGTCQNKNGDALPGWFVEVRKNGVVQNIYSDANSTPVITVSGVANRAKTDALGNFTFFIESGTYKVFYYDQNQVFQSKETEVSMVDLSPESNSRLRTLRLLQESMARTGLRPAVLDTTGVTVAAQSATSTFGAGTFNDWLVTNGHANKFTFLGATWALGAAYPANQVYIPTNMHAGNGTDPSAVPSYRPGATVRFITEAPKLEIYQQVGTNGGGFRLRVDGKYAKQGLIGFTEDSGLRYHLITFGGGVAADRKTRLIELEYGSDGGFGGMRCEKIYAPRPAPQPDGLRLLVHGDSRLSTVVDVTNSLDTQTYGVCGQHIGLLLGQADIWNSSLGGTGWICPQPKTVSWFNDRVQIDVVANAPDVIIETGGSNDQSLITAYGEAAYQALVEAWISAVITAKPETIIFMTGPMAARETENTDANWLKVSNAKQAAAAKFPQNVDFTNNLSQGWVTGTGNQSAPASNGQCDWTLGFDSAHNTCEGNRWYADRIAQAIAKAIPVLIAANS